MFRLGAVFLDKKFPYLDRPGETGAKLLVLLNTPETSGANLVMVKTTSRQRDRPRRPGCIEEGYHKLFHVPAGAEFFRADTWIQLDDHFLFVQGYAAKKLRKIGGLGKKTTAALIACFLQVNSDDLSAVTRDLIEPPLTQAAKALAERFNRKR